VRVVGLITVACYSGFLGVFFCCRVWGCFRGCFVVWGVFVVCLGVVLVLNSPCIATELLGGCFSGVSRVPFVEWGVGAVWMADVGQAGADHSLRVRELARVVLLRLGAGLCSLVLE